MNRNDTMLFLRVVITLIKNRMALDELRDYTKKNYNRNYTNIQRSVPNKPLLTEVNTHDCWNIFQLNAKREKARQTYNAEMKAYNARLVQIDESLKELKTNYVSVVNYIDSEYNKTCELIKKYSNLGIINSNYFTLPALCKFYEYFSKELVDTFKEAYRRYEDDKKHYNLMDRLQDILDSVNSVRDTQRDLYNVVVKMNENIEYACDTLDCILGSLNAINNSIQFSSFQNSMTAFSVSSIDSSLKELNSKLFY